MLVPGFVATFTTTFPKAGVQLILERTPLVLEALDSDLGAAEDDLLAVGGQPRKLVRRATDIERAEAAPIDVDDVDHAGAGVGARSRQERDA